MMRLQCILLVLTVALTTAEARTTSKTINSTTEKLTTITPTTVPFTTPPQRDGCFHEGKWYSPGEEISRGYDGKDWCHGMICDQGGHVMNWDNFNCGPTTTSLPTTVPPQHRPTTESTTPPQPTTIPTAGCNYNGKRYRPGEEISRGFDGKNWCHGYYCDDNGQVVIWDDFKCGSTTTTTPQVPTTAPPYPTTTRSGCFHEGKWYRPGEDISTVHNDFFVCYQYAIFCNLNGEIDTSDPHECTFTPITTQPYYPTTTSGCFHEGKWYLPGQEISRGFDGKNWCHGTYCDVNGLVVAWDDWKCGSTTTPTPQVPTTTPPYATTSRARPRSCFYRGQRYVLNSNILESTNGNGWCFGRRCSDDGQVVLWDDFSCRPSKSGGCLYRGFRYAHGSELFRIKNQSACYGGVCGRNGRIKTWTRMNCRKENQFHGGRLKPSWCKYRGKVYPRGSVFAIKSLFKRHGFGWCRGAKCAANGRIVAWGPKWSPGFC